MDNNKIVGVQVVPVIHHAEHTEVQLGGPTDKTSCWGVYWRMADGKAHWIEDKSTETEADDSAAGFAELRHVEVETKPWTVAAN